ncbi:MAG: hypothetical protein NVS1B3_09000 [Candidatus Dormibacteraceae bacterium]
MTIASVRVPHARLIVTAMAVVAAAAILWLTRGFTFYYDEWSFILDAPNSSWAYYLRPHNEHPTILFKVVYTTLLNTVGLRTYLPYMAVLLALHALDAVLLFELVRRRAGDLVGVAFAAVLLVLGAGAEDILWAFQFAWLASIACGLGALLILQGPPTTAGLGTAVALVAASVMFSGIGLVFTVIAAVQMATSPERRRGLVWFVPLAAAFGAWYLVFGHINATPTDPPASAGNFFRLPAYSLWGLAGAVAGTIGVTGTAALPVLALAAGVIGFTWWRQHPDPPALGVLSGLLSFYLMTGLTRAQLGPWQAASERYVYVGAVLWLILLADAARLLPWRGTWRPALATCLVLVCVNSSALLVTAAAARVGVMQRVVADMQALSLERAGQCLDPSGRVDPRRMPPVTSPAVYYRAIDRYGDPTAGRPITDRTDFDSARRNLLRSGCGPIYT